ncbi:MAG: DUF3592 domain-containing protein [Candidatus Pacebacteria bacterium]|nr:DUF3592 domain-containing protein [Candidatus Paceibacterota bacterium]
MKKIKKVLATSFTLGLLVIFLIIGFFLFRYGWQTFLYQRKFLTNGQRTTGIVVGFTQKRSSSTRGGSSISTHPEVDYQVDETTYRVPNTVSTSFNTWSTGDQVTVIYDPVDPEKAVLDTPTNKWFASILLLILGGGFMFFPSFILLTIIYRLVKYQVRKTKKTASLAFKKLLKKLK